MIYLVSDFAGTVSNIKNHITKTLPDSSIAAFVSFAFANANET